MNLDTISAHLRNFSSHLNPTHPQEKPHQNQTLGLSKLLRAMANICKDCMIYLDCLGSAGNCFS